MASGSTMKEKNAPWGQKAAMGRISSGGDGSERADEHRVLQGSSKGKKKETPYPKHQLIWEPHSVTSSHKVGTLCNLSPLRHADTGGLVLYTQLVETGPKEKRRTIDIASVRLV